VSVRQVHAAAPRAEEDVVTTLLERDGDLGVLREAVGDAADRRGSVVLVVGEAGIGKSTLVRAWSAGPGAEARVLLGYCDDFLTSRTLGPFHDVARSVGGALAEAVQRADTAEVLDLLLEALDDPLRATVLILEDLHWADEATLDVIRYVGRRIGGLPAVLAMTFRDDEVGPDHPLTGVLGALPSSHVRRIRPHPLSHGAIATLTEGTDLDPSEILRRTGGNPFFVTEVVHSGSGVPASVSDSVLARLSALPAASRGAVELLSVLPRPATPSELEDLLDDVGVLAAAEERRILTAEYGTVRFRHELTRQAVLTSLPSSARLRHHESVLTHLERAGADPVAVLHHAVEASRADLIVRHGPGVAHEAFHAGAHRQAVVHQARVLRYAHLLDAPERARLLEEHAWSLYNLHRFATAAEAADQALAVRERLGDATATARAELTAGRMAYMTNRPARCFELLDAAAAAIASVADPDLEAEIRVNRAAMLFLGDRHDEAVVEAVRARELVTLDARPDVHVLAGVYGGGARFARGTAEGTEEIREAIDLGRRTGEIEPTARGYTNLVQFLGIARRWSDAEAVIAEAIDFYDDHDLRAHRYNTVGQLAGMHLFRGHWAAADRLLAEMRATHAEAGVLEPIEAGLDAFLAVRMGRPDVDRSLERSWRLIEANRGSVWHVGPVACIALELAHLREDPTLADRYVTPALEVTAGTFWWDWIAWRLMLLGRDVPPDAVAEGPEATSLRDGWRAGAAAWASLGMPYEQALELLRSGQEQPMLEALAILDRLGAEPGARLARRRLRDLGVRYVPRGPQAVTRMNPSGLTERQLEVLRLLGEGLTNAQIADRLVVSVRTVDHHVSAVLQKLGVDNRQKAAEHARELGAI
jgi:DNA-binding CsgD family transcriptional regulator/tetratricopeptide (TPR) repeat protein